MNHQKTCRNSRSKRSSSGLLCGCFLLLAGLVDSAGAATEAITLSFGRVMPGQAVEQVISFNNPTDSVVEVESIQLTPPLLVEEFTPVIRRGGVGSFKVTLADDRPLGPYTGVISVNYKSPELGSVIFKVTGYFVPPIEFIPSQRLFIATHSGNSKTAAVEIINHNEDPLSLVAAQSRSDRFTTELVALEEGRHYRLTVTLDGSKKPGDSSDEIIVQAKPPLADPIKIQANTRIRPRVYHFPGSVDMGALPYSVATNSEMVRKLSQILMVYRPGTNDFEIDARTNLEFIEMQAERGPEGDRYQIELTLLPEKVTVGEISGAIMITTNDPEFNVLEVPITGHIREQGSQ